MCTSTHAFDPTDSGARSRVLRQKEHLIGALRHHGYALTSTREALVETLAEISGHICAQHLLEMTRDHHPGLRLNKTTVYRNLDVLAQLGLLAEMKDADGRAQYEVVPYGHVGHLRCVRCGKVEHLDEESAAILKNHLARAHGFVPDFGGYPISGVCRSCQADGASHR